MPPRKLLLTAPLLALALLALAACGGDDDDDGARGQLSDPNNVPTATPWALPPEVLVIDPDNIQPIPPESNGGTVDEETPAPGEPGVCGESYVVEGGDTAFGIGEKCGWPADDLGTFVDELEALNPDADVRNLSIGQVLTMPNLPAEEAPEEPAEETAEEPAEETQ
jgi:hypothetical protein